ncbi:MAG: mono/diheme cytochrome c family protein [Verrucomicrobiales bacterium]|jgi:mono/diheme cytochrome c family protein
MFKKLSLFLILATAAGAAAPSEAEKLFTLKVGPLLALKCNGCHGDDAEKIKGDFNTLTREGYLKGGSDIGAEVLVLGHADQSFLMTAIRWDDPDIEMPPKENDRLSEGQIEEVAQWINAGAPWPSEEVQTAIRLEERSREVTEDGTLVKTIGGLGDGWTYRRYLPEDVWAFRPVKKPQLNDPNSNAVDIFVRAKLKQAKANPASQADSRTLIRRATYDLHGLPPTPAETYEFGQVWRKDPEQAWSDLIDRLLASMHYGERWGQHWLDVARYADTAGFSNDYERSNAWRYRDYVIRSFNEDKPYDKFVKEQLAGDEIDANDPEMVVATGFLRMGPFDNAMVMKGEARQLYLDDVVNSVGQTFLSTTMRCFKCHDHKFDPLPTRDYYRMYATFATTQMAERPAPFGAGETLGDADSKAEVKRLLDFATQRKNALVNKRETAAKRWYEENNLPYKDNNARKGDPDEKKPPRHVGMDYVDKGRLKVREQDEWIWNRRLERYEPFALAVYSGPDPKNVFARKLRMEPKRKHDKHWDPDSRIFMGGSYQAPGGKVSPGVLSVLGIPAGNAKPGDPYALPTSVYGRRKAFAEWVVDPQNALASRSIVNRIWQHHFAKPIAGNPNNFGAKGGKPTHPQLLDWLAADFVENGWKIKRLHKMIMMSGTYRQSVRHPEMEQLRHRDPDNKLLAYFTPRRLSAEEMRDTMLSVSGELNPKMGGIPIRPEINMEVALQPRMIQFSIAPAYQPSPTPAQRNRRTIYAYRVRGQADPFLELFNQPNPNDSCEERDAAAVTPQAFSLLNSDTVTDRSIAFALRVQEDADCLEKQIARIYHLAFSRQPSADELAHLMRYVEEMQVYHAKVEPPKADYPTKITRSLVEEFSGSPFEYDEILPVFENYERDKKAADVSAETRALADVCVLVFNSNEFLYVY